MTRNLISSLMLLGLAVSPMASQGRGGRGPQQPAVTGAVWFPSSQMRAIQTKAPAAKIQFDPGDDPAKAFTIKNTGNRAGIEIAQVYLSLPAATQEPPKRLVGWEPVELKAGESKTVTVTVPALHVAIFDTAKDDWQIVPGDYKFMVGGSSRSLPLSSPAKL